METYLPFAGIHTNACESGRPKATRGNWTHFHRAGEALSFPRTSAGCRDERAAERAVKPVGPVPQIPHDRLGSFRAKCPSPRRRKIKKDYKPEVDDDPMVGPGSAGRVSDVRPMTRGPPLHSRVQL